MAIRKVKDYYQVTFKATAKHPSYSQYFSPSKYGSREKALEAAEKHNDLMSKKRAGIDVPELSIPGYEKLIDSISLTTFEEVAEEYIAHLENRVKIGKRSADSTKSLISKIRGILIPFFGDFDPCQIDHDLIDKYQKMRIEKPAFWGKKRCRKGQDGGIDKYQNRYQAGPRTLQDDVVSIKAICRFGAGWFKTVQIRKNTYYTKNDLQCLDYVNGNLKTKTHRKQIEDHEYYELMKHAKADHIKRFIFISYRMGIRPGKGELYDLRWRDWNLDEDDFKVRVKTGKRKDGKIEYREVPVINPSDRKLILEWWIKDGQDPKKLFIQYLGKPVKYFKTGFTNTWKRACKANGWTHKVHPYLMRHGFGAKLKEASVDPSIGASIMGHSAEMFIKNYGQPTMRAKAKAMSQLSDMDYSKIVEEKPKAPVVKLRKKKKTA